MAFVRARTLNLALGVLFVALGLAKLFGLAPWRESFFSWGYPNGFRFLVGCIEVCAGGCLFLPRSVPAGAAVLGLVMLGAIGTHLRSGEAPYALIPATLFTLLAYADLRTRREARGGG